MNTQPAKATRRVWSEFVAARTLRSARVLKMLKERDLELLLAVTPPTLDSLAGVVQACLDAGVPVGLWPMLNDEDGRWGSTFNAEPYAAFVMRVSQLAPPGATMALDLEPPIQLVRRLLRGESSALAELLGNEGRGRGLHALHTLAASLREQGFRLLAAAPPLVLADGRGSSSPWQWLLGTPFEELPFDVISFMSYTSLLEGYSGGLLPRGAALSLHVQTSTRARELWPMKASISLGVVGGGALGDERPYRFVDELREDVSIARACGVDDLGLFDLSGVLSQEQPEAWLDAFCFTEASDELPRFRRRARIVESGITRASQAIGIYRRLRRSDR